MIGRHNLKLASRSLRASKGRNSLTMFGIVVGVMAVILVICIGTGIRQQIAGQLDRYGKDVFSVQPAQTEAANSVTGLAGLSSNLMDQNDLDTIEKTAGVAEAVPLTTATGTVHGDYTINNPFIIATTPAFGDIVKQDVAYGSIFDADSQTVTLGSGIARRLFKDNAPLGETFTWRGRTFLVAGVFDAFAAPPFSVEANFNNAIFMPYSTAQSLSGNSLGIFQVLARADSANNTAKVASSVQSALTSAHGGAADISAQPAGSQTGTSDQTIHLFTLFITGAALIALLVGGVGIMDVMLVSVTERMHEIGLRKAIGATNGQIMRQFMAEALVLSVTGALVGAALSAIVVGLLRLFSSLQPVLVWQVFVVAPLVAVVVGLLFGSLPALKAARKDPIEALRHE